MTDFSDMARGIIESNRYMVLGTADEDGVPWVLLGCGRVVPGDRTLRGTTDERQPR